MGDQGRALREALAADGAFVGLLVGVTVRGQALLTALRGARPPLSGFLWGEAALLGFCEAGIRWGWFCLSLLWGTWLPIVFGWPGALAAAYLLPALQDIPLGSPHPASERLHLPKGCQGRGRLLLPHLKGSWRERVSSKRETFVRDPR
ncbi:hypothetical protein VULLAG_LOCUS10357 [Vulpes lagopus]